MRILYVLLLAALCSSTALAKATHSDAGSAEMRAAFEEATTEYNLGHFDTALAAFERGYRVKNDPVFLFNIGQCQRQLDRPRDAARSYRAYLRESPAVPTEQRAEVERLIGLMDEQVARAAANTPPTGVNPPSPAVAPVVVAAAPADVLVQSPPPPKRRRTALWIGLGVGAGVVAVALAVGLGVGLSSGGGAPGTSLGNSSVSFK